MSFHNKFLINIIAALDNLSQEHTGVILVHAGNLKDAVGKEEQ